MIFPGMSPQRKALIEKLKAEQRELRAKAVNILSQHKAIGKVSEMSEVLHLEPPKGTVVVQTPFGALGYKKKDVPSAKETALVKKLYLQSEEKGMEATRLGMFHVLSEGVTTGGIKVLEDGAALAKRGLLSEEELVYLARLREFWKKHPDADYGVVRKDTIEPRWHEKHVQKNPKMLSGETPEAFLQRISGKTAVFLTGSWGVTGKPGYVYRGVSRAELKNIKRTGVISSRGYGSFRYQKGETQYSMEPGAAHIYATSFAMRGWRPRKDRPGYIIEVKRHSSMTPYPHQPSELTTPVALPASDISRVWQVTPLVEESHPKYSRLDYWDYEDVTHRFRTSALFKKNPDGLFEEDEFLRKAAISAGYTFSAKSLISTGAWSAQQRGLISARSIIRKWGLPFTEETLEAFWLEAPVYAEKHHEIIGHKKEPEYVPYYSPERVMEIESRRREIEPKIRAAAEEEKAKKKKVFVYEPATVEYVEWTKRRRGYEGTRKVLTDCRVEVKQRTAVITCAGKTIKKRIDSAGFKIIAAGKTIWESPAKFYGNPLTLSPNPPLICKGIIRLKPLTLQLYRGTTSEFKSPADAGDLGIGVYYDTDRAVARSYGDIITTKRKPFNTPLILPYSEAYEFAARFKTIVKDPEERRKNAQELTRVLLKQGYDSIIAIRENGHAEVVDYRPVKERIMAARNPLTAEEFKGRMNVIGYNLMMAKQQLKHDPHKAEEYAYTAIGVSELLPLEFPGTKSLRMVEKARKEAMRIIKQADKMQGRYAGNPKAKSFAYGMQFGDTEAFVKFVHKLINSGGAYALNPRLIIPPQFGYGVPEPAPKPKKPAKEVSARTRMVFRELPKPRAPRRAPAGVRISPDDLKAAFMRLQHKVKYISQLAAEEITERQVRAGFYHKIEKGGYGKLIVGIYYGDEIYPLAEERTTTPVDFNQVRVILYNLAEKAYARLDDPQVQSEIIPILRKRFLRIGLKPPKRKPQEEEKALEEMTGRLLYFFREGLRREVPKYEWKETEMHEKLMRFARRTEEVQYEFAMQRLISAEVVRREKGKVLVHQNFVELAKQKFSNILPEWW